MREVVHHEKFIMFGIGGTESRVSNLQFVYDTLLIREASLRNLWTMKAILGWFEFASGLKVNFYKSSIIGANVMEDVLQLAIGFLHCRTGSLPFKYLGLPVGANPKSLSTWQPLLDTM